MKRCLILTGGKLSLAFAGPFLEKNKYEKVIAVDGGLEAAKKLGIIPDVIVGDFDTVHPEILAYYRKMEHIIWEVHQPEKDDTDTEFAIRESIRRGADSITIIGGTGTRLDHVLGNISLLGIGLEEQVAMELLDEHNRIRMIQDALTLEKETQYGKYVSLIPYGGDVQEITLWGFKYLLSDYTMGGFNSLGISNEIVDNRAEIRFRSGILLVIESKD